MKIGFVVNDVLTEKPTYTTTRLAMHATNMGHEAWLLGMGNFAYEPDGSLSVIPKDSLGDGSALADVPGVSDKVPDVAGLPQPDDGHA